MYSILNIFSNIFLFSLNLFLKTKYLLKQLLGKQNKDIVSINDIYFINTETCEIVNPNDGNILVSLNNNLKYSDYFLLNTIIDKFKDYKNLDFILEISYSKNNKNYLFNIPINQINSSSAFPIYTKSDNKFKNMNKITEITGESNIDFDDSELIDILEKYGGPLNDFYQSKEMGIPLSRIYSSKMSCFPFKNHNYILSDIFLNEYTVGPKHEKNQDYVLTLKNTLDETKIVRNNDQEKYILNNYKNFNINSVNIFFDFFRQLFGKQKN